MKNKNPYLLLDGIRCWEVGKDPDGTMRIAIRVDPRKPEVLLLTDTGQRKLPSKDALKSMGYAPKRLRQIEEIIKRDAMLGSIKNAPRIQRALTRRLILRNFKGAFARAVKQDGRKVKGADPRLVFGHLRRGEFK